MMTPDKGSCCGVMSRHDPLNETSRNMSFHSILRERPAHRPEGDETLDREKKDAMFLRAERRADGTRTFRLLPGEPLETSYGEDLYRKIFDGDIENKQSSGPSSMVAD
jgi:hypothetical protein